MFVTARMIANTIQLFAIIRTFFCTTTLFRRCSALQDTDY